MQRRLHCGMLLSAALPEAVNGVMRSAYARSFSIGSQ